MKFPETKNMSYFQKLSEVDKLSLLLHALGPGPTKIILSNLKDGDVKKLVNKMSEINKAPHWIVNLILEEYYHYLNEDEFMIFDNRPSIANAARWMDCKKVA